MGAVCFRKSVTGAVKCERAYVLVQWPAACFVCCLEIARRAAESESETGAGAARPQLGSTLFPAQALGMSEAMCRPVDLKILSGRDGRVNVDNVYSSSFREGRVFEVAVSRGRPLWEGGNVGGAVGWSVSDVAVNGCPPTFLRRR